MVAPLVAVASFPGPGPRDSGFHGLSTPSLMRRRWFLLAVILTVPSGCDNVAWGGIDMRLKAPPKPSDDTPSTLVSDEEADGHRPELPSAPILLAGTLSGDSATLVVAGMVDGDGLSAFPSDSETPGFRDHFTRTLLAPGTELVLFSEGARVGRLTVTRTGSDDRFCVARPTVTGVAELVPGAGDARRVLALSNPEAARRPFSRFRAYDHTYEQRVASLALGSTAIPGVGAPWPPSLLESRADIRAFHLPESPGASIAATFLFRDDLNVAPAADNAYALFVMGTEGAEEYQPSYVWYRRADREGKGAPRYFNHLDWNGDGSSEVLLDIFGAEHRWFAGLARRGDEWVRTFQDPCGEAGA